MRLRELLATNKELTARLDDLEQRVSRKLARHDEAIAGILDAIRQLMAPPPSYSRPIGFIEQLLQSGATLVCIARHAHPALGALAAECGTTLEQWTLRPGRRARGRGATTARDRISRG